MRRNTSNLKISLFHVLCHDIFNFIFSFLQFVSQMLFIDNESDEKEVSRAIANHIARHSEDSYVSFFYRRLLYKKKQRDLAIKSLPIYLAIRRFLNRSQYRLCPLPKVVHKVS